MNNEPSKKTQMHKWTVSIDRASMTMVSMEHHEADKNQDKAVIGDKLMYGVSDP